MMRLTQAVVAVMACTLAAGAAGGVAGATIGTVAPDFVLWLENLNPGQAFEPVQVGLGLGIVSGLLLGASTGSFLVMGFAWRDAWLARAGLLPVERPRRDAEEADGRWPEPAQPSRFRST